MDRNLFYTSLTSWLATTTGRTGDFGQIPGDYTHMPYFILDSINSPPGEGDWEQPERDRDLVIQVTCVGRSAEQATWMSDRAQEALIGRDESGYLYSMATLQGGTVLWRRSDSLGGATPSGDRLFQVVDTYRIRVSE